MKAAVIYVKTAAIATVGSNVISMSVDLYSLILIIEPKINAQL